MTGGIAENIVLKPQSTDISSVLAHLLKLTSIILCKVEAKNAEDVSFTSEFSRLHTSNVLAAFTVAVA